MNYDEHGLFLCKAIRFQSDLKSMLRLNCLFGNIIYGSFHILIFSFMD